MVRLSDSLDMIIAVDWDITPQTKQIRNMNILGQKRGVHITSCKSDFSLYDLGL